MITYDFSYSTMVFARMLLDFEGRLTEQTLMLDGGMLLIHFKINSDLLARGNNTRRRFPSYLSEIIHFPYRPKSSHEVYICPKGSLSINSDIL